MKKLAIISIIVCVISLALTGGLLVKKLNNDDAKKNKTEKVLAKKEESKNKEKKIDEKKIEAKNKGSEEDDKKEEKKTEDTEEKSSGKKAPNFIGKDQVEVYEFAQKHNISYALGEAIPTSKYDLRGKVASQSIKSGDNIPKDQELILHVYVYIEHYDQVKTQDKEINEA